jgi:serine/threonine protein kinase/Tfp pilus assembly protein PilF
VNFYSSGTIIAGRYEVAGRPLLGGMGSVYLCMDHKKDRPVALKTFRPEFLPDRAARDRFLREGTTWVDLGIHPNIVRCYSVEYIGDGREVYLSLELVAKEQGRQDASLRSWMTPGQPLPIKQALLFALQIARGMGHACEQIPGFVHRDLKPENVLVGADRLSSLEINRLRVTDFGLANILQEVGDQMPSLSDPSDPVSRPAFSRTQLTQGIVGTPLYMAPEQWLGEKLGAYTDIYALGCILYEMLTGERVVQDGSLESLQQAHCQGALASLPGSLPKDIAGLLAECLELEPADRYSDWGELENALVTAWETITARQLPPAEANQELDREERVATGWSYINIGYSYRDIGKEDVARTYFERARSLSQAEGERRLEGAALGNLGTAYRLLGITRRAISYFKQALTIHRETENRHGEGNALGNLGITYKLLGDAQRAIDNLEQALNIHREIGDRLGESTSLGNLGALYVALGDTQGAIGYFKQALTIQRENGNRCGEGSTLGDLGNVYRLMGDAKRSIGYFKQALIIHREIGNRRGEGNTLGNLGSAYANLRDAPHAISYFKQSLVITREIDDRIGEGATLSNLGTAYQSLGNNQLAIGYFKQALTIQREIENRHGEGTVLGNLGTAYFNLGDAQRAIGYYEQALEIHQAIGDIRGIATDTLNLAMFHQQEGEPQMAISLANQAERIYAQIGHISFAQRAREFIAQVQGRESPSGSSTDSV